MAIKELAVLVSGTIVDIEQKFVYDNEANAPTDKPDGVLVTLSPLVPGDGFGQVRIAQIDLDKVRPVAGQSVCWVGRYGAWSRNDRASMSVRWVRPVDDDFLGRVNGVYTQNKGRDKTAA